MIYHLGQAVCKDPVNVTLSPSLYDNKHHALILARNAFLSSNICFFLMKMNKIIPAVSLNAFRRDKKTCLNATGHP